MLRRLLLELIALTMIFFSTNISYANDLGGSVDSFVHGVAIQLSLSNLGGSNQYYHMYNTTGAPLDSATPESLVSLPVSFPTLAQRTYRLDNFGATLEPGEPTLGGRMKKTIWASYTAPANRKAVLDTLGSSFVDTALAVYTGPDVKHLKLVAFNDNFTLNGVVRKQSLVQFDAVKGTTYHIQIGGIGGAEGTIFLSAGFLAPGGGLSAHIVEPTDAFQGAGQSYVCRIGGLFGTPQCPQPAFVVVNSSAASMTVTGTTTLGSGITPPATMTLPPKSARLAAFTFSNGYDVTTPRTVSGAFKFTGTASGKTVGAAAIPALALIVNGSPAATTLSLATGRRAGAGLLNQPAGFLATLKNTGGAAAKGCSVRPGTTGQATQAIVQWSSFDPRTKTLGAPNKPFDLAPGATANLAILVADQTSHQADLDFPPLFEIGCVNTDTVPINHGNVFDASTFLRVNPLVIDASVTSPATGTLNVPAGGKAIFTVAAKIVDGDAAPLTVTPVYQRPFSDSDPNTFFSVGVCPAGTTDAACMASSSDSLTVSGAKGTTVSFKVVVKAPPKDPGYDPAQRRVALEFTQSPASDVPGMVAATSIAVRRK